MRQRWIAQAVLCVAGMAGTASAQEYRYTDWPTGNLYGVPGLIDMPGGRPAPEGDFAATVGNFSGMSRFNFSVQATSRLMGGFRYTQIRDFNSAGFGTYYDRSFDLRFTLLNETANIPAVTVGLQDFVGTGIYSAEYLAASKSLGPFEVTTGLGWGRLAGNRISSGFGSRPKLTAARVAEGGDVNFDTLFRGDIGLFGGVAWRASPKLVVKAEYSSDRYELEDRELGIFDRQIPLNFGVEYQPTPGVQLGAYYMYGSELGLRVQFTFNPDRPPAGGSLDSAPPPVLARPDRDKVPAAYATTWTADAATRTDIRDTLAAALLRQGLEMVALRLDADHATLYLRNDRYQAQAQAYGRAARLMTQLLPSSVETFTIVPMGSGMELPAQSFRRSDLERLEMAPDGAEKMLAATTVTQSPAAPLAGEYAPGLYPRLTWYLVPYLRTSLFDPDNPFRYDFGARAGAQFQAAPGLYFSGSVRKKIVGDLDKSTRKSDSSLHHVRSDFNEYDKHADPGIDTLTGAYYFQPGTDLYGRFTAGYLETMYAGVSGEMLWAPYDSPLALGVEMNYLRQRDFDGGFGLFDYTVATGFASAYWRVNQDFTAKLDVGRYLAKDYGATLSLSRVFANGWSVGAFATFTDVSAKQFGEGSFDKGITLTIPLGWFNGKSNNVVAPITMRPLTRDGGQQVNVDGRLYGIVNQARQQHVDEEWGRFWR